MCDLDFKQIKENIPYLKEWVFRIEQGIDVQQELEKFQYDEQQKKQQSQKKHSLKKNEFVQLVESDDVVKNRIISYLQEDLMFIKTQLGINNDQILYQVYPESTEFLDFMELRNLSKVQLIENLLYIYQRKIVQDKEEQVFINDQMVNDYHNINIILTQLRKQITEASKNNTNLIHHKNYNPCDHQGICSKENKCSCILSESLCEAYCSCKIYCLNSFQGCACSQSVKRMKANDLTSICKSLTCKCFEFRRECDPNRCTGCKGQACIDFYQKIACSNQHFIAYNTLNQQLYVAPSQLNKNISGLYTHKKIKKEEMITEYIGKIFDNDNGKEYITA